METERIQAAGRFINVTKENATQPSTQNKSIGDCDPRNPTVQKVTQYA